MGGVGRSGGTENVVEHGDANSASAFSVRESGKGNGLKAMLSARMKEGKVIAKISRMEAAFFGRSFPVREIIK